MSEGNKCPQCGRDNVDVHNLHTAIEALSKSVSELQKELAEFKEKQRETNETLTVLSIC